MIKIYGNPGSGKYSVSKAAIQYLYERQFFPDGMIHIKHQSDLSFVEQFASHFEAEI